MNKYFTSWICCIYLITSGLTACISNNEIEIENDPIIIHETKDSSYAFGNVLMPVSDVVGSIHFSKELNIWYISDARKEHVGNGAYFCLNLPEAFQKPIYQDVYFSGDIYYYHLSSNTSLAAIPLEMQTKDSTLYCVKISDIRDYSDYQHKAADGCYSGEILEIKNETIVLTIRLVPENHIFKNFFHENKVITFNRNDIPIDMQKEWNIIDFDIIEYSNYTSPQTTEKQSISYVCKIKVCE